MKRQIRMETKKNQVLASMAESAVNIKYFKNGIWITIDGTKAFRVSNESNMTHRTVAIQEVDELMRELRENWIAAHKNDRIEARA